MMEARVIGRIARIRHEGNMARITLAYDVRDEHTQKLAHVRTDFVIRDDDKSLREPELHKGDLVEAFGSVRTRLVDGQLDQYLGAKSFRVIATARSA